MISGSVHKESVQETTDQCVKAAPTRSASRCDPSVLKFHFLVCQLRSRARFFHGNTSLPREVKIEIPGD